MTISVLIIAHNEAEGIASTIESLLAQTKKADEIVLINHNSTDTTGDIARVYPITVVDYEGPRGPVHARMKGFEVVTGDLILCIDGDSIAAPNWIETLSELLAQEGMVMVGSWIRMTGTFYAFLGSCSWFVRCPSTGERATDFLWGASFAIRGTEREAAIKALQRGDALSKELALAYNPDDYWLALFMYARGGLAVTNRTWVKARAKEKNSWQSFIRGLIAGGIRSRIHQYLAHHTLPRL